MTNYPEVASNIINIHDLRKYLDILVGYWKKNPPTMGHGFKHVIEVAVEAYNLAELNDSPEPEISFLVGLFHDIYRPAKGGGLEDHHTKVARTVKKLLKENDIDSKIIEKIDNIISDDRSTWTGRKKPDLQSLVLFYADKIALHPQMADAYAYAVNKYQEDNKKPIIYNEPLDTLADFAIYQQDLWKVFKKHQIIGYRRAVDSIVNVFVEVSDKYSRGMNSHIYQNYLSSGADIYIDEEKHYLKKLAFDKKTIEKLTKNY